MFQMNSWYVAAYPSELSKTPLARTLLNEPLVLYRTESGKAAALADQCIHRMLPLSKGRVCGERLQCGYHGALYDTAGRCVEVPGQSSVPEKAKVKSYPVQERYGFVWVWMGDPALAATVEPCSLYSYLDEDGWDTHDGYIYIKADYLLSNDNLADVTHTEFVHGSTLGVDTVRVARKDGQALEQQGEHTFESHLRSDGFDARMYLHNTKVPPTMEAAYAYTYGKENCDNLDFDLHFNFTAPCFWVFSPRINKPGASDDKRVWVNGILVNTPETKYTTHFFHKLCQNYRPEDKAVTRYWFEQTTTAFHEDQAILEYQQRCIGASDVHDHEVVSFEGDRLGFVARRIVRSQQQAMDKPSMRTGTGK